LYPIDESFITKETGFRTMEKFLNGDRVQVIAVPGRGKKHLNKTGVARGPGGTGHKDDDVLVIFDDGAFGYFKAHQLRKVD
jgi:hypothetical protein